MGGKGDSTGGTLELPQASTFFLTVPGSSIGTVDGALAYGRVAGGSAAAGGPAAGSAGGSGSAADPEAAQSELGEVFAAFESFWASAFLTR